MQEHEINVAVRIEFRPAKAADGHERDGKGGERTGVFGHRFVPQMSQQRVQNGGARLANFTSVRAAAMQQLQTVRLDFEKIFVTRQLFRRRGVG